jgi:hypothetical protein
MPLVPQVHVHGNRDRYGHQRHDIVDAAGHVPGIQQLAGELPSERSMSSWSFRIDARGL